MTVLTVSVTVKVAIAVVPVAGHVPGVTENFPFVVRVVVESVTSPVGDAATL